jgi:hypothetical protein
MINNESFTLHDFLSTHKKLLNNTDNSNSHLVEVLRFNYLPADHDYVEIKHNLVKQEFEILRCGHEFCSSEGQQLIANGRFRIKIRYKNDPVFKQRLQKIIGGRQLSNNRFFMVTLAGEKPFCSMMPGGGSCSGRVQNGVRKVWSQRYRGFLIC